MRQPLSWSLGRKMISNIENDGEMTQEQRRLTSALLSKDIQGIDETLLFNITGTWRKVARVVGMTMSEQGHRVPGIPDVYYAERVRQLVNLGCVEARGNLHSMRFSEVRIRTEQLAIQSTVQPTKQLSAKGELGPTRRSTRLPGSSLR